MSQVFISHSSQDDDFVRELRETLARFNVDTWIDSRALRGGDPLWSEIQQAIETATAYAVVVSPNGLQSKWVGKELRHALAVQQQRGKANFAVIPLSLDDTKLGVLEEFFDDEPLYIPISSAPGGSEAALHALLVALGIRLPSDVPPSPQPKAEPLHDLVLELTDLKFHDQDGVRRPSARAKLVYQPADPAQREVESSQSWRLTAPLGPIEAGELRWYLEQYPIWPSEHFAPRAKRLEAALIEWGRLLYAQALPLQHTANVLQAWAKINGGANRRFSVLIEADLEHGAADAEQAAAREAATLLMGLPWELLHDGDSFLFQGKHPTRVRRRLPNTRPLDVAVVATPIRILLVSARPEDQACGYISHRASALPLVEAMETLGGLVQIRVLDPPTLPALNNELTRADAAGQPYHVLHFDGHGVYDRRVGLGGLCFEHPDDTGKLYSRRHQTVYTDELGPLLKDQRIPLVFLEACQTAQAEQAADSVASELLKTGVASVVAMSHSVLVETARRFVQAFYAALAGGRRVGDAMLAGQRCLKDDPGRGQVFGAGELRLQDWFVPVLFQERDDPQLFKTVPAPQTVQDLQQALNARLGALPAAPATGFIGRSRELLALQRLLRRERYAVLRGQGGEGKTALACELARWLVRSQQIRRVGFVSLETHGHADAVLDALGRQLAGSNYSVATFADRDLAVQPIERELREQATLLVLDNLESVLLPPFLAAATPDALAEDGRVELAAILQLCARLLKAGDTRLVFTSREALPAPFDAAKQLIELRQLAQDDAIQLVERVLNEAGQNAPTAANPAIDASRETIVQLVEAVHCHARTLALLAPAIRTRGVGATQASLVELMAEMHRRFPDSREHSLFASVELSLQRLSPDHRERVKVLGVFHGSADLDVLRHMTQWEPDDVEALAGELIATGLATANPYHHLSLNPALCPFLRCGLSQAERQSLTKRWTELMQAYVFSLDQQKFKNPEIAATLTALELANLFALLELVKRAGEPATTIDLATALFGLLQNAGKPRLLQRVGRVRDAAAKALGDTWNHSAFQAASTQIEQLWASGQLHEALAGADQLLHRARAAGEQAYPGADYDLAMACFLCGRMLRTADAAEQALPVLDEARRRFEAIAEAEQNPAAARMAANCFGDQGDSLRYLGRFDEAASAHQTAIDRSERLGDRRSVAVGKGQLGLVYSAQGRYPEALAAHQAARESFAALGEPNMVAAMWHQTGMAYQDAGQAEAAEQAYRNALSIKIQLDDVAGQSRTLVQLGNLYDDLLDLPEQAADFYRQAADHYVSLGDLANEGRARNNLADTLCKLGRFDQARLEIRRAIECKSNSGHAGSVWNAWNILSNIENAAGDQAAAKEARAKALACYLAYRRDGGENHSGAGRLALAVGQALLAGEVEPVVSALAELAADPAWANFADFIDALQAIATGNRDPGLANADGLHYQAAAEILLLLETLQQAGL